jgi:alanyl-tRNA synthetase
MKHMTSAEIRQAFLDYFEEMGHKVVPSSPLVPGNDPTLLFTNAGMVQFKDVFLGLDQRPYNRATTVQKCMRVSGKHNDLENVGPSPRHHTFFEMLGNFSFGDYFKSGAIRFAYDLMTKVFQLPPERLYYTVHTSDDEAYRIWTEEIGISPDRVHRLGDKDNFWQMADTGPCGPTSEIFWDRDPSRGIDFDSIERDFNNDSDRLFELWNLVFMQYNQSADGTRDLLPKPSVDTGAGLERVTAVLQGVYSNYETDLFMPILARIQQLAGTTDEQRKENFVPYNVIADHMRAASFLIAEGVTPGPKDRGYICRMLIRRAARFGRRIGFTQPFLADVADTVIDTMGGHYKELPDKRDAIRKALTQEEVRFGRTLERGLEQLEEMLGELPEGGQLSGEAAFFLKGSLGLPFEVTRDVAQERGYMVDQEGFETAQRRHEIDSGAGHAMGKIEQGAGYNTLLDELKSGGKLRTSGVAYDPYSSMERNAHLLALLRDGQPVTSAEVGDRVEVVLDTTPFYVEAGGQISDTGTIHGEGWTIDIEDVRRPVSGLIVHIGEVVEGQPTINTDAVASVDAPRRLDIMRNHTATHLLHAQLRAVLGNHVQQRGSLVAPDRLRFDFSHDAPLTGEEIQTITANINDAIMANMPVVTVEKDLQSARAEGAMALFGEKYGDRVRTVTVQDNGNRYSYELCGGTHVPSTAVIGSFIVSAESSVAQGIRRIEALTGHGAQQFVNRQLNTLRQTAAQLGATPEQVGERIEALREEVTQARQENAKLRRNLARLDFERLLDRIETIDGIPVLIAQVQSTTPETLREMTDWFRDKVKQGVVVLGMESDGKPQLIAAVSDDLTKRVHAGNLIKTVAATIGGGGGGRPNMAQAGGKDASKLSEALTQARQWVTDALNGKAA